MVIHIAANFFALELLACFTWKLFQNLAKMMISLQKQEK